MVALLFHILFLWFLIVRFLKT